MPSKNRQLKGVAGYAIACLPRFFFMTASLHYAYVTAYLFALPRTLPRAKVLFWPSFAPPRTFDARQGTFLAFVRSTSHISRYQGTFCALVRSTSHISGTPRPPPSRYRKNGCTTGAVP